MCGRFTLRTSMSVIAKQFGPANELPLRARYNVAPTQSVPVVRIDEGQRRLTTMHWGLIPSWAKDAKIGYSTINARADTIATKPAFRAAFKKRRCLVVADGYYEWFKQGKAKKPVLYEVDGGAPFAFAGLWEQWWGPDNKDGPPLESCTVVTTDANELASQVHNRMPVILGESDYETWLDPANQDAENLQQLLAPFSADRMTARPVNPIVNNARNEGPECVSPVDGE